MAATTEILQLVLAGAGFATSGTVGLLSLINLSVAVRNGVKAYKAQNFLNTALAEGRHVSLDDLLHVLEGLPISSYTDDLHELVLKALTPAAAEA